jgi:hypothetical protein
MVSNLSSDAGLDFRKDPDGTWALTRQAQVQLNFLRCASSIPAVGCPKDFRE